MAKSTDNLFASQNVVPVLGTYINNSPRRGTFLRLMKANQPTKLSQKDVRELHADDRKPAQLHFPWCRP